MAISTALHGKGGFGKTMLAHLVCADARVRGHFPGGVLAIELGQEMRGAALAAAIAEVTANVSGGQVQTYTRPDEAGRALCAALDKTPRILLLLDDVCFEDQLLDEGSIPYTANGDPENAADDRCNRGGSSEFLASGVL